jgi:cytochrome c-type biogenesis protein CcmH
VADLAQRTTELGREIGVDVASRLRRPQAAAGGGVLSVLKQQAGDVANAPRKGPSAEDVSAAETMAPSDRMAMIRGMVEGLANRLDQSPRDAEGWIKLIRSRTVLGETDAAKQALDRALKVFSDAPQEQARIAASARELGLMQ